ncbi:MAG: WYL domain-containing protein [Spirosomataceae bacterium]
MPINRNALIRYKVIDSCLQRRNRKWTLENLIEAVSDALYEYEGIDKGISKRSIQADIQMMRSDKLGYFAPIIVIDKKYYTYEDPTYSITNIPLSEADLQKMNAAVEMLKQFKGFSHFSQLNDVVQKLEDHVYSSAKKSFPVIDFEKNDGLKGLNFLDDLYQSVIQKKVVKITYQSFTAQQAQTFSFHTWWLKEFKNRWFAVGTKNHQKNILTLALDRIIELQLLENAEYFQNELYTPEAYYKDVVGVSVSPTLRPMKLKLFVSARHAPYVKTKPLHPSQQVLQESEKGILVQIQVQHNFEIEKEILSFGEGMVVLEPPKFREIVQKRLEWQLSQYQKSAEELMEK